VRVRDRGPDFKAARRCGAEPWSAALVPKEPLRNRYDLTRTWLAAGRARWRTGGDQRHSASRIRWRR